jgi:hypothetical protein
MEQNENDLDPDLITSVPSGFQTEQQAGELRPKMPMAEDKGQPMPKASPEVLSFYSRYSAAMLTWSKEKGNTNFPIVEDPKTGRLYWVNRKTRRKNQKREQKAKENV